MKWYAFYTKPRWEKKVHSLLLIKGIESYCPLNKVTRKWSDRLKIVEEPLFKSYVFAKVDDMLINSVREVNGIINVVYWNGKPANVKEEEIVAIKKFLNEYQDVGVVSNCLNAGSVVLINQGPLMDKKATIMRIMGQQVEVMIESLGFKLVAKISKHNLSPAS